MQLDAGSSPLDGVTVVEVGNIIAAPMVGLILGDFGADVIKVERPGSGDIMRNYGDTGTAIFEALNRNKRSITLDVQTPPGRDTYRDLTADADVVIENFRPGVADRLGVGYSDLAAENESLVYVSISGFLPGGPYEDRPGMDMVGQVLSGLMYMTREPDEKPLRAGASIVDIGSALYGTVGVLLALFSRTSTGRGQHIHVGLFESASHLTNYWTVYAQLFGRDPDPLGSSHPAFTLYDLFQTADDDWVFLAVITDRHWPALCRALGREDLIDDGRFETLESRKAHEDDLYEIVTASVASMQRDHLVEALIEEGVPSGPVNAPSDLVDDPQLHANDLLVREEETGESIDGVVDEAVQFLKTPILGTQIRPVHRFGAPAVGEHTHEILESAGYSADDIATLAAAGAFGDTDA